jgi:hypothetical protein
MKIHTYAVLALMVGSWLLATGCSKPEQATAPPAAEVQKTPQVVAPDMKAATQAIASAVDQTTAQVQAQTQAVQTAAQRALADAQPAAAGITSKTQSIIDDVKKLLAQSKWSEALKMLNDLAATKLTPEQQTTVDSLKQQALKLGQDAAAAQVTDPGTRAINNLLPKK